MSGHGRSKRCCSLKSRTTAIHQSKGRSCWRRPGRLVDNTRSIRAKGIAHVDNPDVISADLVNQVATKSFLLDISTENVSTGISMTYTGQAGLILGERPTPSPQQPPDKKRAVGEESKASPSATPVFHSRFAAIPTTCLHHVVTEYNSDGVLEKYDRSKLIVIDGSTRVIHDFAQAGIDNKTLKINNPYVVREADRSKTNAADDDSGGFVWQYGVDVTTAGPINNTSSPFTKKERLFTKMTRVDYQLKQRQKVAIAVFRDFDIEAADTGDPLLTQDAIKRIYGEKMRVNIYTGEITRVCEVGRCLEHDINTFAGCSGAIVFLLDQHQPENVGLLPED